MGGNFLYDPRKLYLAGFAAAAAVMGLGVMDYNYRLEHWLLLLGFAATQVPLFLLGPLRIRIQGEVSNAMGWLLVGVSMLLVGINIHTLGMPYLVLKLTSGMALNAAFGDYYHELARFTFVLWPLLTMMIPLSLFCRSRVLRVVMILWPTLAAVAIQIKAPFLFGAIYYATLWQMTGRRMKVLPVAIGFASILVLFFAVNATRTSEDLKRVAVIMGLREPWTDVNPAISFPLSYVGGPVVNGFVTASYEPFRFDGSFLPRMLPAAAQSALHYDDDLFDKIDARTGLPWPLTNNAHSSIASTTYLFGVVGALLIVMLSSWGLIWLARNEFMGSTLLLALFIIAVKNIALFPIGNYFIDPSLLGEWLVLAVCLSAADVRVIAEPAEVDQLAAKGAA